MGHVGTDIYAQKMAKWKAAQRYRQRRKEAGRKARERREFMAFLRSKADRALDRAADEWLTNNGFR
jgi:hypothetical protein